MTTRKLLEKLKDILNAKRNAQVTKYKSLKEVLKSLRKKKVKLEGELSTETSDEKREKILSKLHVISAQRKKGLEVLKELKVERKQK